MNREDTTDTLNPIPQGDPQFQALLTQAGALLPLVLEPARREGLIREAATLTWPWMQDLGMEPGEERDDWVRHGLLSVVMDQLDELAGRTEENHPEVPAGSYCYQQLSRMGRLGNGELGYHTATCVHWSMRGEDGWCALLGTGDAELWAAGRHSALHDQLKTCSIRRETGNEGEELDLPSPAEHLEQRQLSIN